MSAHDEVMAVHFDGANQGSTTVRDKGKWVSMGYLMDRESRRGKELKWYHVNPNAKGNKMKCHKWS